jgi:hypothetical protein
MRSDNRGGATAAAPLRIDARRIVCTSRLDDPFRERER